MSTQVAPEVKSEILKLHDNILSVVDRYSAEVKALDGKYETTVGDMLAKMNVRMDQLEIQAFHNNTSIAKHKKSFVKEDHDPKVKSAWEKYLRKGETRISPEETKLMTVGDDTTGGFFAIPEMANEIIKNVILISYIRNYARVRTTATNSVKIPKRTGTFAASWTNEVQTQSEAVGLQYNLEDIPNHAMTAYCDISLEDLEDSSFDLIGQLNEEFAEQFALAEGNAFVAGSGKGQPEGYMGNAAVAYDPTGFASNLGPSGDVFTTCAYNLKTVYAQQATWFLNRQTIGQVRLLKDEQNRPLWLPFAESGLAAGAGPQIVGIPYAEVPAMPNVGAGLYPVALGAWKKAYVIVDRLGISVTRDNITQLNRGVVRFYARKRVGGQLVLAEAVRKIKVSVS